MPMSSIWISSLKAIVSAIADLDAGASGSRKYHSKIVSVRS
jgi:hypothetical protein